MLNKLNDSSWSLHSMTFPQDRQQCLTLLHNFLRSKIPARKYPESSPLRKTIVREVKLPGIKGERPEFPSSVLDSRLSGRNISSDHIQAVAGGFESLLGFVVRNKSGVVIKGYIVFSGAG